MNTETMWGTIRWASRNQNIGRGTAAWQIIPDGNKVPKQLCVLPLAAAEVQVKYPFPSWESRSGCPAKKYNDGTFCQPCPPGTAQDTSTAGLEVTTCKACAAGKGAAVP